MYHQYQCPTSQHGSIFDPLLGVYWWFRYAGSVHSIFLGGRPVALELCRKQLERSGSWQGRLQTSAEVPFIYTVLKHFIALEMFVDDTLYKLTYSYLIT